MDENISHFQSMLDQNPIQFPLLFISTHQNPYDQDNFGLNENQRQQNLDHDNFFSASPNPFRGQSRLREKCQSRNGFHNNWKNEFTEAKIQNFEENNISQTFFMEQRSSDALYEQSSTQSKDKQSNNHPYQQIKKYRTYKRQKHVKLDPQSNFQLQLSQQFSPTPYKRQGTLKYISQIIYQMIQTHDNLSFAEVTNRLIRYVSDQQSKKGKQLSESKVKNIKRRVYDGLNVLIAAGVAKKVGKRVRVVEKCKKQIIIRRRPKLVSIKMKKWQHRNKVNELKEQISECQKILQAKRKALNQLKQQKQHLQTFFKYQSQTHLLHKPSNIIKFPFVCITTNQLSNCQIYQSQRSKNDRAQDYSSTCDTEREGDVVEIVFGSGNMLEGIKIEGDVDFVEGLGRLYGGKMEG